MIIAGGLSSRNGQASRLPAVSGTPSSATNDTTAVAMT
jgi:hypothetical protein